MIISFYQIQSFSEQSSQASSVLAQTWLKRRGGHQSILLIKKNLSTFCRKEPQMKCVYILKPKERESIQPIPIIPSRDPLVASPRPPEVKVEQGVNLVQGGQASSPSGGQQPTFGGGGSGVQQGGLAGVSTSSSPSTSAHSSASVSPRGSTLITRLEELKSRLAV